MDDLNSQEFQLLSKGENYKYKIILLLENVFTWIKIRVSSLSSHLLKILMATVSPLDLITPSRTVANPPLNEL